MVHHPDRITVTYGEKFGTIFIPARTEENTFTEHPEFRDIFDGVGWNLTKLYDMLGL